MSSWFSSRLGLRGRPFLLALACLFVLIPVTAGAQKLVTNPERPAATPSADASAPDFTLSLAAAALTVQPSGTATVAVTITPLNNFSDAVNLSCAGLPANTLCSFSPVTTPPNSGKTISVLTILTGIKQSAENRSGAAGMGALACGVLCLGLLGRRRRLLFAACVLLLPAGLMLNGCGSHPDAPAGTSNVTITATSAGGISHSQTFQLTVK